MSLSSKLSDRFCKNTLVLKTCNSCTSVTKVEKADDNLTEKIAIPVGLSLLWLLVVVGVTCYMKRYFTEKLRNATVEPEMATKSNGLTTAVAT